MADALSLINGFDRLPEGWTETNKGSLRTSQLNVGDLTKLLHQTFKGSWRFNQLTNKIELDGEPVPSAEIELFYTHLSLKGWSIAKNAAIDAARAAANANSFNPVEEYLNRVASDDSITPIELVTVAKDYLDVTDELSNAMLRATLIGAVKRTYEPGCLHRTVLVLKGGQEIGKSSFVRNLASPDWVCDTSHDNDKDFILGVHSAWISELAELDSITSKKEAGKLKNLISSPKDSIRPPYGRAIETFPRRSILIGTSNRDDFLHDETGSSRWWVIDLPHNADRDFRINHDRVRADRDAIWKAAVLAYRAGEQPRLTAVQQAESNRRNLGFEVEHPWEDYIAEWVEKDGSEPFTTEQCLYLSNCKNCGFVAPVRNSPFPPVDHKDAVEAGKILRRLGYVKDKHQPREDGKKLKRMWRRVDASTASRPHGGPEAGQTPTGKSAASDRPHVSNSFFEKEKGKAPRFFAEEKLLETPEAPEAQPQGSAYDVCDDEPL